MNLKTYYLLSLGCAKNTVDSESIGSLLAEAGYSGTGDPTQAGLLIVNTCGFIEAARQESVECLQDLTAHKKKGQIVLAAGCLPDRSREYLLKNVTGLDGIIGTKRWMDMVEFVEKVRQRPKGSAPLFHLPDVPGVGQDDHGVVRAAVQGSSAYLKIADGCRRPCAFCSIPLIKGGLVSRPMEAILADARALENAGVRELNLIAQDTTDYGHDLGMKDGLAQLLEQLTQTVPGIPWLRILYAYPGYVTDRLIEVMAGHRQVLHYLDIPLQHAHPDTLKRMHRPSDMDWVYRTIEKMRKAMPDLAIRSTFIVGYPGETEEEFSTLLNFIKEIRLDHVGAFTFSFEPGTASEPLGDPIPQEVKEHRMQLLMEAQEKVSLACNQKHIGKTMQVLIEGYDDGVSIGRAYHDAPEIDGLVILQGKAPVGEMVLTRITGAMVHDLSAELVKSPRH